MPSGSDASLTRRLPLPGAGKPWGAGCAVPPPVGAPCSRAPRAWQAWLRPCCSGPPGANRKSSVPLLHRKLSLFLQPASRKRKALARQNRTSCSRNPAAPAWLMAPPPGGCRGDPRPPTTRATVRRLPLPPRPGSRRILPLLPPPPSSRTPLLSSRTPLLSSRTPLLSSRAKSRDLPPSSPTRSGIPFPTRSRPGGAPAYLLVYVPEPVRPGGMHLFQCSPHPTLRP